MSNNLVVKTKDEEREKENYPLPSPRILRDVFSTNVSTDLVVSDTDSILPFRFLSNVLDEGSHVSLPLTPPPFVNNLR